MRARIFCEVTCIHCGAVALGSRFYQNSSTISHLKEKTKDWIWSEVYGGNLCLSCQKEVEDCEE